jgi:hypothetical protein
VVYEVPTTTEIRKHLQVPFFEILLKGVNEGISADSGFVWVDARELTDVVTEEVATVLVNFITKFST